MAKVVGIGAGGHAKVLIEVLRAAGTHDVVALTDDAAAMKGKRVLGVEVLGGDEALATLLAGGVTHAFIGVGGAQDTSLRRRLFDKARAMGFTMVDAIHPSAVVSPSATHGIGVSIMPAAVVHAAARLGDNVTINTGAIVEHDCVLGHHVHMATGARLASTVTIGDGAHIGLASAVRQGLKIGERAVVAAGAVVVKDVPAGVTVAGVPAEPMRDSR